MRDCEDHPALTSDFARPGPIHIVHDIPHRVVESLFGIADGAVVELAAGSHAAASRSATASATPTGISKDGSPPGPQPPASHDVAYSRAPLGEDDH